jgi:putative ABC transport system ATP-binding protein
VNDHRAPPRLRAENLVLPLDGGAVVRCPSFAAAAGAVTLLRGASGSGKTTLLRALATLSPRRPGTAGTIFLDGVDIATMPPTGYRRRVGFVAQAAPMLAGTVADNLRAGPRLAGRDLPDERLTQLLRAVDIGPSFLAREALSLSGGEKQRVAFARALANDPEALLLDEPTSALDAEAAEHVLVTISRLAQEEKLALVVVSHRREDQAHFAAEDGVIYEAAGGTVSRQERR